MKQLFLFISLVKISSSVTGQSLPDSNKNWSYHFQLTAINQTHPAFKASYSGDNSLFNRAESKNLSLTTTMFLGRKLWSNGAIYFNPEITGGSGIGDTKGIAGFTNGETFRIGSTEPKLYVARLYFKQHFALKNSGYTVVESDANQVQEKIPTSRITIIAGKICLTDFFDMNAYSHDPRSQFMNWSLMSNGAWDYPADTRGYTEGIVVELIKPSWAVRFASVVEPRKANGLQLDYKVTKAHAETIEIEKRWTVKRPGTIRFLFFHNLSQAPTYSTTLTEVKNGDSTSVQVYTGVKEWKKYGGVKYGFGINAEQELSGSAGVFFKASWNDGKTATWAYTEIDRSVSAGINIKGGVLHVQWNLPRGMGAIHKSHKTFFFCNRAYFFYGKPQTGAAADMADEDHPGFGA